MMNEAFGQKPFLSSFLFPFTSCYIAELFFSFLFAVKESEEASLWNQMFVSPEGMKMRGMKNETNGLAKPSKVVSDETYVRSTTSLWS